MTTLPRRLLAKFTVGDGCWIWTGARSSAGYGYVWDGERTIPAHRAVYEWLVGPIPAGKQLDHLCRNRPCVRPDHLEPVTRRENIRRGDAGGPQRRRTHCPRGHAYTFENTYVHGGRRGCKRCINRRSREAQARKRAAA